MLLDAGADINAVGGKYGTALGAAAYKGHEATVLLLLSRSADINAMGGEYGTALGAAAYKGNITMASLLLDRGADVNRVCGDYGTALGVAAYYSHEELALLLLGRGADAQHVGGRHHATHGGYPTAMDAAAAGKGGPGLIARLAEAMDHWQAIEASRGDLAPPFPMPYTESAPKSSLQRRQKVPTTNASWGGAHAQSAFCAGGILTLDQADLPCK
ncbi:ankyrin repeat-containing domain protein [Kalaharituber pfeilii]|nr:ankyrin repeat-containing domain protein [Kalaharituber pfeilii]